MDSLSFLGTGPGDIDAGRFQSSILLKSGDNHFLLDAGEPCSQRLIESGWGLEIIDAVFLTHCHADHVGGLPLLIQGAWLAGRTRPLPVYLPAHLAAPLRAWLDAILLHKVKIKFDVQLIPWEEGASQDLGAISVCPWRTSHIPPLEGEPRAFLLDLHLCSGKRLVYSGDLGKASDLSSVLTSPIDVLICELAHLTPEDVIETLKVAKIDMLCLTHLSRDYDDRRAQTKITIEEGLPDLGYIYLPLDGETIEL